MYQELDEKLQQAFEDMLTERGVTPELGEYLMRLSEDKEQREYMGLAAARGRRHQVTAALGAAQGLVRVAAAAGAGFGSCEYCWVGSYLVPGVHMHAGMHCLGRVAACESMPMVIARSSP